MFSRTKIKILKEIDKNIESLRYYQYRLARVSSYFRCFPC